MVYYNDNDPLCVGWLEELISAGLIPHGVVDSRSIADVPSEDLDGFSQVHLFAGIGGWAYALRLAGWPDDRPIWTGSCPCQPFSIAGKKRGTADRRHLWPAFRWLIRTERRPPIVVGEQVAGKNGRAWLAGVRADLEVLGYAVGAADLCAAGIGAPQIRQRLWWVADAGRGERQRRGVVGEAETSAGRTASPSEEGGQRRSREAGERAKSQPSDDGPSSGMADSDGQGSQGWNDEGLPECTSQCPSWAGVPCRWHTCKDGKCRRIPLEPALFPLADGLSGRVGLLRGAGNAIVPQVAAMFIRATGLLD